MKSFLLGILLSCSTAAVGSLGYHGYKVMEQIQDDIADHQEVLRIIVDFLASEPEDSGINI